MTEPNQEICTTCGDFYEDDDCAWCYCEQCAEPVCGECEQILGGHVFCPDCADEICIKADSIPLIYSEDEDESDESDE